MSDGSELFARDGNAFGLVSARLEQQQCEDEVYGVVEEEGGKKDEGERGAECPINVAG